MSNKKSSINFNIDNAISRIAHPSVFDRIVKEIDVEKIPACFIESIVVQYYDGNVVEISGECFKNPIIMHRNFQYDAVDDEFKKMRDVRVFINTNKLEKEINELVERYLGKYC